jgi:PhzF family phenazine biosynthesis protein
MRVALSGRVGFIACTLRHMIMVSGMRVPFYQVDAFTDKAFRGNPAAICFMSTGLSDDLYLSIAQEMNLSETAFVEEVGAGRYNLRWFTPVREVPLCGHATLATGHAIFEHRGYEDDRVEFLTLAGSLYAERVPKGIRLDFPENKPFPVEPPSEALDALGISEWGEISYSDTNQKLVVLLGDEGEVRGASPDFEALLGAYNPLGWRGVVVTAQGSGRYEFVSRYFAPLMGIDEDPVTGSAHTVLAPYWGERLGKTRMWAYQASERGGALFVELVGGRVLITGGCMTVIDGELSY